MTDINEVWRIIREYLENWDSNKLEEMDKFLDTHDPPTWNQEDIKT
jgi:hypothetical protein